MLTFVAQKLPTQIGDTTIWSEQRIFFKPCEIKITYFDMSLYDIFAKVGGFKHHKEELINICISKVLEGIVFLTESCNERKSIYNQFVNYFILSHFE